MRLVLDTNVVASALLWGGIPRQLLEAGHSGRIQLFTSIPLLAELSDILERPKFEKKIAASMLSVDQIIERYAMLAIVVRPESIPRTAADPDDDVVIGTALAALADLIVSGDSHLLDLKTYGEIRMVTASAAIEQIHGSVSWIKTDSASRRGRVFHESRPQEYKVQPTLPFGFEIPVTGRLILIGVGLAYLAEWGTLLYGVKGDDSWTIGAVSLRLLRGGLDAALIPGQRAARVNPMEALETE